MLILTVWIVQYIHQSTCESISTSSTNLRTYERYESHPCIPVEGRTALVIGQDYDSISNYTQQVKDNSAPFGLMSYTALKNNYGELSGTTYPIDYGSGVEWSEGLSIKYPQSSIQLGLWIVGQCATIANGTYDAIIDRLASYIKQSRSDYFLRIGYEFDSALNNYPVVDYVNAYQRIVSRFRSLGVRNIKFVWHAAGFGPRDSLEYQDWFPGQSFVDLCGVSLFQQPYGDMTHPDRFALFCSLRDIPIMIAESTPYGGIVEEDATNDAGVIGDTWSIWFSVVLAYIDRHEVRMWSYINCDWNSQDMWRKNHAPGEQWGDTRIEVHPALYSRWVGEVLRRERFVTRYPSTEMKFVDTCMPVDSHHKDRNRSDDELPRNALSEYLSRVWTFLSYSVNYILLVSFIVLAVAVLYYQICIVPANDYVIIP